MTGMRQNEVTTLVCLRIALGFARRGTQERNGLEIIRHRIPVSRITIPGFKRHEFAYFLTNKFTGERDAGIKAAVIADLENQVGSIPLRLEFFALSDVHAQRLLDEDMLSCRNGLQTKWNM